MDNSVVTYQPQVDIVLISMDEARQIDAEIVSTTASLKEALAKMYETSGFIVLGYSSWDEYLRSVSGRAGLSTSTLRRYAINAVTSAKLGLPVGAIPESQTRAVTDILSPRKGFNDDDRQAAFADALDGVDGDLDRLTAAILASSAKSHYMASRAAKNDNVATLVTRLQDGELSVEDAYGLCLMIESVQNDDVGSFLSELSDSKAGAVALNALPTERAKDIISTALQTGYIDTVEEMVPVGAASDRDILSALNAESSIQRKEDAQSKRRVLEMALKSAVEIAKEGDRYDYNVAIILIASYLITGVRAWPWGDVTTTEWDEMIKAGLPMARSIGNLETLVTAVLERDSWADGPGVLARCYTIIASTI